MATGFSVFVNIGGKVDGSLSAAVASAKRQVNSLATAFSGIGRAVQAPFVHIEKSLKQTEKQLAALQRKGRDASLWLSAPAAYAGKGMFDNLLGTEKELNRLQAYGELTREERDRLEVNAASIARTGRVGLQDAIAMSRRFIQAGRSVEETIGMTKAAIDFSIFGDVDAAKAADAITGIAAAYQLVAKNAKEAEDIAWRVGDILAKGANISKADVPDFTEGFKYAAPLAARAGVTPEMLAAAIATEVQKGIPGQEAGVNIRSMLVRMVKPTAAARGVLASKGLGMADFVTKWNSPDLGSLGSFMMEKGVNIDKVKGRLMKSIAGLDINTQSENIRKRLSEGIIKGLKLKPRDAKIAAGAVSDWVYQLADEIDFDKFVRTLQDKGLTLGEITRLFDARQGARSQTLFGDKTYNEMYEKIITGAPGSSKRGAELMIQGLYGSVLRLKSAWDLFIKKLGDAGATAGLTDFFERMAKWLNNLNAADKETLKLATTLGAAAVAAGPLMWILGAIGRVGLRAVRGVTMAFAGLAWGAGAAVAGTKVAFAAMGAGAVSAIARIRTLGTAIALLGVSGGARVVLASIGASLLSFGKAALMFPVTAIRAIGAAMWALVANPVGAIITAAVVALTALGVWVYNNWDGIKSFFSGFAEGFTNALGPTATEGLQKITDLFGTLYKWVSDLLGPISASNEQWKGWGATVGGVVADAVNAVVNGISKLVGLFTSAYDGAVRLKNALFGLGGSAQAPATPMPGGAPFVRRRNRNAIEGRARGGPVTMARPYIVGERGPELFVPSASGRIETNGMLNRMVADAAREQANSSRATAFSNPNIEIKIDAPGADAREIARQAENAVYRALTRLESDQRGLLSD